MLLVTVAVAAPAGQAIGIKEDLAMQLEKFGTTTVPDIQSVPPEQLSRGGKMLVISVTVDASAVRITEIKRDLSKHLDYFGDARILDVKELTPEQMCIGGEVDD